MSPSESARERLIYKVRSIRQETPDISTIELVRADGGTVPPFAPGQYNMLHLNGVGAAAMAICVDPADPTVLLHTVRSVGKVTLALTNLELGSEIDVSGPYGCGWPLTPAEENDVVLVAGGVGLAPMRALIFSLLDHRERYGHISLLYGARTPEDILFRRDLERWRGRFDMEVLVTVDRASRNWRGHVGVFTTLIPRAPFDPYYTAAYLAGPEVMMTYAVEALVRRGVRKDWQYLYMQRDLKRGLRTLEGAGVPASDLTGPVFRYDEVESALSEHA